MDNTLNPLKQNPSVDVANEEWYKTADAIFNARMADARELGQPGGYDSYVVEARKYKSNMNPLETMGYLHAQQTIDSNWEYAQNMGKSVYNGAMGVFRGSLNAIRAARDYNIALLNEQAAAQGIERKPDQSFIDALDNASKAETLQPYAITQSSSKVGQFGLDIAQGAGQLAGQMVGAVAANAVLPFVGGPALMMAQIAGEQYEDLKAKGADTKRAAEASFYNATIQTPFEYLALTKLMKRIPAGSVFKKKLRMVLEDALTEGLTETIQQFPEEWAELWAMNPDKSWKELREIAAKKFPDTMQNALYAGMIGAVLGAGSRGVHIAIDKNIDLELRKEVHDEAIKTMEGRIDSIRQSGISPDYAGETINANLKNATVLIDGEVLQAYAQMVGEEKTAEKLGVSADTISSAASNGDTVEVNQGNFEALAAADPKFLEAVRDDLSFDAKDMSNNAYNQIQVNIENYSKMAEEQRKELKEEVDKIGKTLEETGRPKSEVEGWKALFTQVALKWSPDNPAEFVRNNRLRFERGGRQRANALLQTSTQIAAKYPNWMDNQVVTDEDSKKGQTTQITGTVKTYEKVGNFIKDKLPKDAKILDASSGMGLGTLALRNMGIEVEDIEPYPGGDRMKTNLPTFYGVDAYEQARRSGKQYDYIISNAVLNVIPDDWRQSVLHDMASLLKVGGQMFINVRKKGEEKNIKNKIELDSPQEVLVGTPDRIVSYQRFYTPKELADYVKSELGDAYEVVIANEGNSGTKGLPAVVVTKRYDAPDGYYQQIGNAYFQESPDGSVVVAPGVVELNAASARDEDTQKYLREVMVQKGLTEKEQQGVLDWIEKYVSIAEGLLDKHPSMREWHEKAFKRFTLQNGVQIPAVSAFKNNGEYEYNIDLGSLCTKREALDFIIQLLVDNGMSQKIGPTQYTALSDMLAEMGFLTHCKICFVEGKRVRVLMDANKFSFEWRSVLRALGIEDDNVVGDERHFTPEQMARLEAMTDETPVPVIDPKTGQQKMKKVKDKKTGEEKLVPETEKAFKLAYKKFMPMYARRQTGDAGITADKMFKIAKLFKEDASLAGIFKPEWLQTSRGTSWLIDKFGKTSLKGVLASMYGAATSKPLEYFSVYDPISWGTMFDRKNGAEGLMKHLYDIGGVRAQSFTDFNPMLFVDYVQMVADLAVRALPMHTYTKVPSFVKLFGETGMMINMSLVAKVDPNTDAEHAGLVWNPKTKEWDYAWADESFPVEEAFALRKNPKYGGRVGTIAVALSDAHMEKLLADPRIDQVIPFHKSGMSEEVLAMTGLNRAKDFTAEQTEKNVPAGMSVISYNALLQKHKDPRKATDAYLEWCDDNGVTPTFPKYRDNPNYYKLQEDFRGYNNNGKPVIQGAVMMQLPKNAKEILDEAWAERGAYMEKLAGLKNNPQFMEKAMKRLEPQHIDGEVRKELMRRLRNIMGSKNVIALQQGDFLDALEKSEAQTTGKAAAKKRVEVFRNGRGIVYGFTHNGKIYLNENTFNANTPAHEFTHEWVQVARKVNPKLWNHGKSMLKDTYEWVQVTHDPLYANIRGDENAIASEVLARIVGRENEAFVRDFMDKGQLEKQIRTEYNDNPKERDRLLKFVKYGTGKALRKQIMDWFKELWDNVRSLFDPVKKGQYPTYDEFVHMPLKDLWDSTAEGNKTSTTDYSKRFAKALSEIYKNGGIEDMPASEYENRGGDYGTEQVAASAIELQGELLQQDSTTKGSFDPFTDGEAVIKLFKGADASTVIHETGHYFIESMWREILAGRATKQQKADFEKLMKYCDLTTEQWGKLDVEGRRAAHERLAEAFETYIMEDKAPTRELRPVFKRFAKWLKAVYASVSRNKNAVPLTDEVREVFDRMLASEEDVEEMKRVEGYFAKLPKVITDNLSDASKKRIEDYILKAQDKAVEILTKERLANFREERKKEIENFRNMISDDVQKEVAARPLYVASRAVREVIGGEHAASARTYANQYLENKMRPERIVEWSIVAEQNGFTADELAQKLINEPTEKEAYNVAMNEAVQKEFPDYYTEKEQAEEATRMAMYNDESGILVGVEQVLITDYAAKTLGRQMVKEAESEANKQEPEVKLPKRDAETVRKMAMAKRQQAKVAAKKELANMKLKDATNVNKYIAAERRCAVKSAEAMAKKDYETARHYKDMQAFNHAMVIESANLKKRVQQYQKFLRKQFKSKRESWTNEQHFNQAMQLFARMGYMNKNYDPTTKTQSLLEYLNEMADWYYSFGEIPEWLADDNWAIPNPNNMRFEDYEKVIDLIEYIKTMAKAEKADNFFDSKATYNEWKEQAIENLNKLATKFAPILGERQTATWMEKFTAAYQTLDNFLEKMDGWHYGFFSRHFGDAIKHANDNEYTHLEAYQKRKAEIENAWCPTKEAIEKAGEDIYYEELGASANKFVLTKMLMNLGNEGNARKLCSSYPSEALRGSSLWVFPDALLNKDEAIEQTKENLIEFLGKVLTKEDIAYAQAKVDLAGMYWGEIAELERKTKGFSPKKVEAYPVTIKLANGEEVVFRGGYFPLIRNGEMGSHPAGVMPVSDTDPQQGKNIRTLSTNSGHTIARVEAVYPVDLTEGSEDRAMRDAIHDLCWRETMTQFRRLLNDQTMFGLMKSKLGIADMSAFREMLEQAAQPNSGASMAMGENLMAQTAGWLRRKTVNSIVMLNLRINLQNFGNFFLYGNTVEGFGYSDVLAAMSNAFSKGFDGKSFSEMWDFVDEKSAFMRERSTSPDITLAELREEGKLNKWERMATDWGAKAMMYTDGMTARPVWVQAYTKKINEGKTEQEAIDFADTIIRRTLGSGRVTDVASLQRGGPVYKLFTAFQGFFNTQFNQWVREYNIDRTLWTEGNTTEAVQRITAFVASKYLAACLFNLVFALEKPFDKDDDEYMNYTKELLHYPMSLVGIYGPIANFAMDKALGMKAYSYRMSIIESSLDKVFRATGKLGKMVEGDFEAGLEGLTDVMGIAAGVPAQMNRLFWNAWDIFVNGMDPRLEDLATRRPKRERKK